MNESTIATKDNAAREDVAVTRSDDNGPVQSLPVVRPRHHLCEADGAWEVAVVLPGVTRQDIDVRFEDETLEISATRRVDVPEGWRPLRREIPACRFVLELTVRVPVDRDAVSARLENGVLTLRLPKREEAKPRRIAVE